MARKILWALLALAPLTILARYVFDLGDVPLFVLSAAALVPLAWLIGEATEHAGDHTGPGVGGFLNASFGNAPELIIALFAIADGLPNVVRASLAGSVVSNLLLVLGLAIVMGPERALDRRSLVPQLGVSVPGFSGNPERHSLAVETLPVAALLLVLYVVVTTSVLRRHREIHAREGGEAGAGWTLPVALAALAAATGATAVISEILVHTLQAFADAAGMSQFFIAIVIVAIVGNAAEHGGAVVIARRGKLKLASEIAISSSAQVAVLVTPAVALLSWLVKPTLPLAFRPVELATMAGATIAVALVIYDADARRREGVFLIATYVGFVVWFLLAGDR